MTYKKIYSTTLYNDLNDSDAIWHGNKEKRFRTCAATVGTTSNGEFTYLRSYNTIVCAIDNENGEAYDLLRVRYGYTATSAQHIAKFVHDYNARRLYRFDSDANGIYYTRQW